MTILLLLLLNLWLSRVSVADWERPVSVVLYPVNADRRNDTQRYIEALDKAHFAAIDQFLVRESHRFGLTKKSLLTIDVARPSGVVPPQIKNDASVLESIIWSLRMRWWSWHNDNWKGSEPDVRIYLQYYSPQGELSPAHSLGLQKGMIGVVNGFAGIDYINLNNVVIVHELLHTLGASDKYDLHTGEPYYPEGYADPDKIPLLPQSRAEIMGGRVKVSPAWLLMPRSLEDVVVGSETAQELGWY